MWRARSLIALALVLLGAAQSRADLSPDAVPAADDQARRKQVVAQGAGVAITIGQLEDTIARQTPSLRAKYKNPVELKALVDSLVRSELLSNEAERRGYQSALPVRYLAKDAAAQALVRGEIDEKITPESIALEDVTAYYQAHPDEFHRVAMRRASQIVFDAPAEAERLLAEAKKADPRAFAELAKQHSKDPETKALGGDLGYFAREPAQDPPRDKTQVSVPAAVRKAVFALAEVGDTGKQPAELGTQRVLVRYTAERPERHVSLEDATLSIRAKLWRERRQKALDHLYAALRAKEKPQVFTDRIYKIDFDDMEKRPSGFTPDPAPPASPATPPAAQKAAQPPRAR